MRNLRKMMEKFIFVDDEEWMYVCSKFTKITVKKGEIVHHAGNVFSDVWFIRNGLARSYFMDFAGLSPLIANRQLATLLFSDQI